MNPETIWSMFAKTGAPELYLLYLQALHDMDSVSA